jgi:predicted NAD/FAD-binding protein
MQVGGNDTRDLVLVVTLSAIAVLTPSATAQTLAQQRGLRVDTDQRVTLDNSYPSLEALLVELSWRAGFELRSFGVEDRAVSARFADVPLSDALRTLARSVLGRPLLPRVRAC